MYNKLRKNEGDHEKHKNHDVINDRYDTMSSLIAWNISKLLERKPSIDLKAEIAAMQELLETKSWEVSKVVSNRPEDRYLACALLAWQQMGRGDTNGLYQFIQSKLKATGENESDSKVTEDIYIVSTSEISFKPDIFINKKETIFSDSSNSFNLDSGADYGPVLKLPVDTKIVMRCENTNKPRFPSKKCQITQHGEVEKRVNAEVVLLTLDGAWCWKNQKKAGKTVSHPIWLRHTKGRLMKGFSIVAPNTTIKYQSVCYRIPCDKYVS